MGLKVNRYGAKGESLWGEGENLWGEGENLWGAKVKGYGV